MALLVAANHHQYKELPLSRQDRTYTRQVFPAPPEPASPEPASLPPPPQAESPPETSASPPEPQPPPPPALSSLFQDMIAVDKRSRRRGDQRRCIAEGKRKRGCRCKCKCVAERRNCFVGGRGPRGERRRDVRGCLYRHYLAMEQEGTAPKAASPPIGCKLRLTDVWERGRKRQDEKEEYESGSGWSYRALVTSLEEESVTVCMCGPGGGEGRQPEALITANSSCRETWSAVELLDYFNYEGESFINVNGLKSR